MPSFHFNSSTDVDYTCGPATLYQQNLDLLRLLKALETEQRPPTPDEQARLSKYSGWAPPSLLNLAFPDRAKDKLKSSARLADILTADELNSIKHSSLTTYYTPLGGWTDVNGRPAQSHCLIQSGQLILHLRRTGSSWDYGEGVNGGQTPRWRRQVYSSLGLKIRA